VAEAKYDEHALRLGARALYLFSDGALDVRPTATERLGSEGLRTLITRYAALAPEPRLRALLGTLKRMRLVDDTTLLLLQEPVGKTAQTLLELSFPACADELRRVRAALRGVLDAQDVAPSLRDRLILAVDEACSNIIRHAYGVGKTGCIALQLSREQDMLLFELRDTAPVVDPARLKPRDLAECRLGGLGLPFIDALMDEWQLAPAADGTGNVLRMWKRLALEEPE
jgi:sigma-B regulation protein RsbU (phosphoserine phosphatase)